MPTVSTGPSYIEEFTKPTSPTIAEFSIWRSCRHRRGCTFYCFPHCKDQLGVCSSGFSSDLKNYRKLEDFDVSKIIFNSATFGKKLYKIQSQKTETNLNSITTTCVPRLWDGICKAICPCKKTRPIRRAITVPKFKGIKTALINEGMSHTYVWEPCISWQKAYILPG